MSQWSGYFSDFGGKAYLDCAAQGPFPKETVEEVHRALRLKDHPEEIEPAVFEDLPARGRAAAARLIGCNPTSIALGTGASHGLNVAARGLPLERGDEVLLARGEFPANVYPWLNLESRGVRVRFAEPGPGRFVDAGAMIRAMGPNTRVVSVSLVAFSTGYRIDLRELGEACRRRGAFLVIDGAQAIGAIDFRVGDFPIDVLAVSGYKWLFGPYGSGFTYINPKILDRVRVTDVIWHGVEGAIHLNRRTAYRLQFREGARRFDMPEPASFLNLSAFAASVEFLNRIRVTTIEAHVRRLFDHLLKGIPTTRLRVASELRPESRSTILSLEGSTVEETRAVYRRVVQNGVVVSLRDNLIRVSPNIYNTTGDIDRFLATAAG